MYEKKCPVSRIGTALESVKNGSILYETLKGFFSKGLIKRTLGEYLFLDLKIKSACLSI